MLNNKYLVILSSQKMSCTISSHENLNIRCNANAGHAPCRGHELTYNTI